MKKLTLIIAILCSGLLLQAQADSPERIEYLENNLFVIDEMYNEVVAYEDNKIGEYNGCSTKRGIKVIVNKVNFDEAKYPSKADLILDDNGKKIKCTAEGLRDLCNADREWMDRIFEPGRKLVVDFLECGNAGYLSIGRVKVIR